MGSGSISHELLKYFYFLPDEIPSAYGGCPIFVADRGFASYNVFAHALEKGSFFTIRAKDVKKTIMKE